MVFTDVKIGLVEIYFKDLPACCSISGNMEGKTVHSTFKFELLHEFANVNKYPSLFKNFDVKTCHSEKWPVRVLEDVKWILFSDQ